MTTDYLYEIQQAMITVLAEDEALGGMVNGVYNHVPLNAKFPYIAVDNIIAKDVGTRTTNGYHAGMVIRVFSRSRSGMEASNIIAEIRRIVDAATFTPAGCSVSATKEIESSVTRMSDGITWYGSTSYLITMQEGEDIFVADGSNFILKAGDGASPTETFTTIGGIRNASIALANRTIDATNISSGKWRSLVSGAGIGSVAVSGTGFFSNSVYEEVVRLHAFTGSINNYQVALGNNNTITGGFMVAAYKRDGGVTGEEEFAILLESSGEVVFV